MSKWRLELKDIGRACSAMVMQTCGNCAAYDKCQDEKKTNEAHRCNKYEPKIRMIED